MLGCSGLGEEGAESLQVELTRLDPDRIPGPCRLDAVDEDSSQARDLRLQCGQTAGGSFEPELVKETLGCDGLVRVEKQVDEQRALSRTCEPERLTSGNHFDWAEDSEVHGASNGERTTEL